MWTLKLGKVTYYSTVICYTYVFFSISIFLNIYLGNDSVQHCMNQQRVFVVSFAKNDAPGGHLFIIDRFNGEMLNKIENIHAHGIQGVSIYENSILGMIANEISNTTYIKI